MERLLNAATERAMKVQEVILKAMAKLITWWQAEILGIHDRTMRRWRARYERSGYDGLVDRRKGRPSEKRVAVETVEQVLMLYRTTTSILTCGISTKNYGRSTESRSAIHGSKKRCRARDWSKRRGAGKSIANDGHVDHCPE